VKIIEDLWQVGGEGLTAPGDAAVYLVRFGRQAALIDAGCGPDHQQLMDRAFRRFLGPRKRKTFHPTVSRYFHRLQYVFVYKYWQAVCRFWDTDFCQRFSICLKLHCYYDVYMKF
jgi:hypothetical protein